MDKEIDKVEINTTEYDKYGYKRSHDKKEEELVHFTFPAWNREGYLQFVAEWKELYKQHSRYTRLYKKYAKTVHNRITEAESAEMDKLAPSLTESKPYNGQWYQRYDGQKAFIRWELKQRARILLAMRKAGKRWAAKAYQESKNPTIKAA